MPHRRLQRQRQLTHQFQHALVAGIAEFPLLVDVEKRNARLQRRVQVATTGNQDVCLVVPESLQQCLRTTVGDHPGVVAHDLADARLVFLGGFVGASGDHRHAKILESRDHRPTLDATGIEQHPLAGQALAPGLQGSANPRLLAADHRLGTRGQIGVPEQRREVAESLRSIGDPVKASLEIGHTEGLFEFACDIEQRFGADHHRRLRPMHGLHFMKACVPGERAQDPQAEFVEQRREVPELAGDVVFANQVHVVHGDSWPLRGRRHRVRFAAADHVFEHRFPGDAIAEVLGAIEAGTVDGHHRHPPALAGGFGDRFEVVADQCRNTRGVEEHRLGRVVVDGLLDRQEQSLLAATHDHVLLGEVSGHADAVQRRA